jgi:secreted Zn-dependent insulinase-like peptidase
MTVSVVPEKDCLSISVEGYNSDLEIHTVFNHVLKWYGILSGSVNNDPIDDQIYELVYNDVKIELQNYQYSDPYMLIGPEFRNMINNVHNISNEEMIEALKIFAPDKMNNKKNKINYKNFRSYCVELMTTGDIMGVFGGSISMKNINKIVRMLDSSIQKKSDGLSSIRYTISRERFSLKHIKRSTNPNNNESAIGYGLYVGNIRETCQPEINILDSWKVIKPMCIMLEGYISEKFSACVRTEKEVGYVAISNILNVNQKNNQDLFLVFVVQSTRDDLEDVVKEYVDNHMFKDVKKITDPEFETMKDSVISTLSEKALNIYEDCGEKMKELLETYEDVNSMSNININERFLRRQTMINSMTHITKNVFFRFVKKILRNKIRSTILIVPHKD